MSFIQVMVDVSHFQPNEIYVKKTDNNIIVHGEPIINYISFNVSYKVGVKLFF